VSMAPVRLQMASVAFLQNPAMRMALYQKSCFTLSVSSILLRVLCEFLKIGF
jgi:hypothetical protein